MLGGDFGDGVSYGPHFAVVGGPVGGVARTCGGPCGSVPRCGSVAGWLIR